MSRAPTDLELEQLALGELDGDAMGVPADDPRVAALRTSDDEIRARYPSRTVALRVQERLSAQRKRRLGLWMGALAPVAAAALLLIVMPPPADEGFDEGPDHTLIKGQGADVQVFALAEGAPVRVTRARAGERVQLAIVPAGAQHAALLSLDGRGSVTLHFPPREDGATAVSPRETLRLPDSFELDDAPVFERFVLVTSQAPIDVPAVLAAARSLARDPALRASGALPLPEGLSQTSRSIEKVSAP